MRSQLVQPQMPIDLWQVRPPTRRRSHLAHLGQHAARLESQTVAALFRYVLFTPSLERMSSFADIGSTARLDVSKLELTSTLLSIQQTLPRFSTARPSSASSPHPPRPCTSRTARPLSLAVSVARSSSRDHDGHHVRPPAGPARSSTVRLDCVPLVACFPCVLVSPATWLSPRLRVPRASSRGWSRSLGRKLGSDLSSG